ncbi:MAG: BamA/TamA family outer membrane protein [Candidatus Kapaibacteriota bacterium]
MAILIFHFIPILSQLRVNDVFIERLNVFDSTSTDWFFAAKLANSLHFLTREYVIKDELLFSKGDVIDESILLETEKNLRSLNLFSKVEISLDSLDPLTCDVYVLTKDRWSTNPSLLFGTGGEAFRLGFRIEELNFLGTGTTIVPEVLYRSENDTKLQLRFKLYQRRLIRSNFSFNYNFFINRFRTLHNLAFWKPYFSRNSVNSYGISFVNNFGNDLLFTGNGRYQKMNFYEKGAELWYSHSWFKEDKLFITGLVDIRKVIRGAPEFIRAFDNSGKVFVAFSSISEHFFKSEKLNTFLTEDVVVGGWGSAILGRTFRIDTNGTDAFYLAGIGEKSYLSPDARLYLFARLAGGSAFANSIGFNTYQEFWWLMFYRFSNNFLFATQVKQQTVWNWRGVRQFLLDDKHYIRGYTLNELTGDNRLIANAEFRFFPNFKFWIFQFSGVVFYDGGTVWNQNVELIKARWHNSAGFGIRIHNDKTAGKLGIVRIDFAYNFDRKKFAEIIISSDQFFSIFKSHQFELPETLGEEFEYE